MAVSKLYLSVQRGEQVSHFPLHPIPPTFCIYIIHFSFFSLVKEKITHLLTTGTYILIFIDKCHGEHLVAEDYDSSLAHHERIKWRTVVSIAVQCSPRMLTMEMVSYAKCQKAFSDNLRASHLSSVTLQAPAGGAKSSAEAQMI